MIKYNPPSKTTSFFGILAFSLGIVFQFEKVKRLVEYSLVWCRCKSIKHSENIPISVPFHSNACS